MGALLLDPTCCMCTLPQSNANLNNDLKTKKNDYQTSRGLEDGRTNSSTIKIAKPIRKRSPIRKSKVTRVSTEECDEEYNGSQKRSLLNVKMIFIAHQLFLCKCQLMCK